MPSIHRKPRRAAGYILLEAILALAVFSGIAAYQIRQQRDDLVESMAAAQGQHMKRVADAANLYAVNNFPNVVDNLPVAIPATICPPGLGGGVNVVNTRSPTIAELACLGLLPAGSTNNAMFGGGYRIQLNPNPAGCAIPNCDITGYLITTAPVLSDNIISAKVIGRALLEIGADGGASGLAGPANAIRSLGTGNPILTPGFAVLPGMLAVNLGATVTQFNQYLRRDGTLPMMGDLNMLNNVTAARRSINNANEVNAITVNGTTVNSNNLAVNGQVVTDLNMDQNNINNAGQVSGQDIRASGFMHVGAVANINDLCPEDGRLARLADGALLNCRLIPGVGLRWSQASDLGSYCVIQARNESCPAGFSAVDPGSGIGGDEGLAGNFVFGGSSSRDDDVDVRGPRPGSGRTNRHTVQTWAFCCK
jgi:hypothetical protein